MKLYCRLHKGNHDLTSGQVEKLVYGLAAHLAETQSEPQEFAGEEDAFSRLYSWCPKEELQNAWDAEMFRDEVETQVENRKAAQ